MLTFICKLSEPGFGGIFRNTGFLSELEFYGIKELAESSSHRTKMQIQ